MSIRWRAAATYLGAVLLVLGVMVWASWRVLELDQQRAAAVENADLEDRVRLGLWRMDSLLAPILAAENARPVSEYAAFFPIPDYDLVPSDRTDNDQLSRTPLIDLYFELDQRGQLHSPQLLASAVSGQRNSDAEWTNRLARLQSIFDSAAVLQAKDAAKSNQEWPGATRRLEIEMEPAPVAVQAKRSTKEFQQRQQNISSFNRLNQPSADASVATAVTAGWLTPVWLDNQLFVVRTVRAADVQTLQGFWINWRSLEESLRLLVADLLPDATFAPATAGAELASTRRLAALPIELIPGNVGAHALPPASPLRWSLLVAWICVGLAAAAVGLLVYGTVSLSERRGDFVSAVTHELRTPITTFRMYADLLADGMVREPEQQKQYFETLRSEATRLGHLVENVLAYARLERGRTLRMIEDCQVVALTQQIAERHTPHITGAGMTLVVEIAEDAGEWMLRTDPVSIDQILFNLIDNACKYARSAQDRRIHLSVSRDNQHAVWRVSDHGVGLPRTSERRLFRPFAKSAKVAASTAPGVGLGLALSRRLARSLGGTLTTDPSAQEGAAFVLRLPLG